MEFGIFIQGHVPQSRVDRESDAEHNALVQEAELVKLADRTGWKYVWVTEHHFLEEYSHLSANEVYLGYLAGITERIHLGSGIFNTNPPVNHPVRVAERVAMLDHLSEGRFEFGSGRGAGSLEVTGFLPNTDVTKAIWDEVVRELPRMWRETDYSFEGDSFTFPHPESKVETRNVLPKPWKKPHPAMWVAAGNPPTYEKAARNGLGVLGFNVAAIKDMVPMVEAYKGAIDEADPIGDFVNDNVMITNGVVCMEDGQEARKVACNMGLGYLQSLVFRYHDTFPRPEEVPQWPETIPEPTMEDVEYRIQEGFMLCGDPDEVVEQVRNYQDVGCDQLVFGMPLDMPWEAAFETVRLFGEHVIPKFDDDPVHRTTRFRDQAASGS